MKKKQKALVTGATKGIGRAISQKLAQKGYHVYLNYHRDHEAACSIENTIKSEGGSCQLLRFDVSNQEEVEKSLQPLCQNESLAIDVLINNAGIMEDSTLVWMSPGSWRKVLGTNLDAFFYVTKLVVKNMIVQRKGRIISIASTAGQAGMKGQVNYSASKGGIISASKSLAQEVASRGITVNVVSPGFIETEMLEGLDFKKIKNQIPMKRLGTANEVACAVMFLASEESSYITGQVLSVNGGIYM